MGPFVLAWLVGEGIISFRAVSRQGGPPWPGELLVGSGAFAILAIISEAGPNARRLSLWIAWGLNIAAFLNLYQNTPVAKVLPGEAKKGWWTNVTKHKIGAGDFLPSGNCSPKTTTSTQAQGGLVIGSTVTNAAGGKSAPITSQTGQGTQGALGGVQTRF